jgi:4-amino-4-deoxy-L-arabinose transferase-like glycosyltransferase
MRLFVAALVLVGAGLRFFHLASQSLWVDEMMTLRVAEFGGPLKARDVFSNIQGPIHTYLINLLARASMTEFVLRLPSVVAGVALIPAVYLLGKALAGRRAGFIAASLATVSPFAIWYSQEVRNYSFLMFFSAVSSLLAWRILTGQRRRWVAYVLASAAAIYSNLSAVFLIAGQYLFGLPALSHRKRLLVRWLVAGVAILALFAPLAVVGLGGWVENDDVAGRVTLAPTSADEQLLRGETTFTPMALPYAFVTMVYGYSLGPSLREMHLVSPLQAYAGHLWLVVPAALAALVALVVGVVALHRRKPALAYVLTATVVPVAAASILAMLNIKPFNVRYVSVVFPFVMVALGAGMSRSRRVGSLLWGLVVLLCLVSAWGYYFDPRYAREDVRAAARYVQAHEEPGDVVLVPVVPHLFAFYFEGQAEQRVLYKGQVRSPEDIAANVASLTEGSSRLWFVDSRLWSIDEKRSLPAFLNATYLLMDRETFPGATVSLYRLRAAAGEPNETSDRVSRTDKP